MKVVKPRATARLALDYRFGKDGRFPVLVELAFTGKKRRYRLGHEITEDE